MILQEILRVKGVDVHTIRPDATLNDVVLELVRYNVGSLMVMQNMPESSEPSMVGIITERDILRVHAEHSTPLKQLVVRNFMSTDLITAQPSDQLQDAMRLMTEHRIRHLPIVSEGQLCGMISIGDIVKAHHNQMRMENFHMRSYIQGEGAALGTAPDPPPT